jgi:hypothetical protein
MPVSITIDRRSLLNGMGLERIVVHIVIANICSADASVVPYAVAHLFDRDPWRHAAGRRLGAS